MNVEEISLKNVPSRRACERVSLSLPVTLIASNLGSAIISHGRTFDLSECGIGIATDVALQPGQPVSLEFSVPLRSQLIKVRAMVKHHSDNFYGLQFDQATEQQLRQIRKITAGF